MSPSCRTKSEFLVTVFFPSGCRLALPLLGPQVAAQSWLERAQPQGQPEYLTKHTCLEQGALAGRGGDQLSGCLAVVSPGTAAPRAGVPTSGPLPGAWDPALTRPASGRRVAVRREAEGRRDGLVPRGLRPTHYQPRGRGGQRAQAAAAAGGDGRVARAPGSRPLGSPCWAPGGAWACPRARALLDPKAPERQQQLQTLPRRRVTLAPHPTSGEHPQTSSGAAPALTAGQAPGRSLAGPVASVPPAMRGGWSRGHGRTLPSPSRTAPASCRRGVPGAARLPRGGWREVAQGASAALVTLRFPERLKCF